MKKIILTLTLLTALSPLRAQDTIFPLDTNYLLYDSSYMDYTSDVIFRRSFNVLYGGDSTAKEFNLARHILLSLFPLAGW